MALTLRVHRAPSWLARRLGWRAEREVDDADARFVFLWIGFNAAYAGDVAAGMEGERFRDFFATLVRLDARGRLYATLWRRFPQEVRVLLDNRYVFAPFWAHHNDMPGYDDWAERLERARGVAGRALAAQDSPRVLSILFDRLYVLRNQLVHGGATWNSDINRAQVGDGAALLGCLLPVFVDLMMDHPDQDWPMPHYPVVE